jgi:D-glycero-D-manno-heptose 1,7-bisphosphate phosphatase
MNGDSWIDVDLCGFSYAWKGQSEDALAQLLLHKVDDASRFGAVEQSGGIVRAFREKGAGAGVSGWINAGVYVLRRAVVEQMPAAGAISLERDVLPSIVAKGKVRAVQAPVGTYFIDIGVPESYERAQVELPKARTRPAIFLDRDGTLNRDEGYTWKPADLQWTDGARDAIRLANEAGFYVFVATNQSGVARGLWSETDIEGFHLAMQDDLFRIGAHIDDIAWCPHHPEGNLFQYATVCDSRKPGAGMLRRLMARWPVDASRSVMIGDKDSDMAAGAAAGLRSKLYSGGALSDLVAEVLDQDRQDRHVDQ